jgi:hypothetical protein
MNSEAEKTHSNPLCKCDPCTCKPMCTCGLDVDNPVSIAGIWDADSETMTYTVKLKRRN